MNYTYDENGNIIMLEDPSLNFNNPNNTSLLSSITPIERILSISADQAITGLIRGMANVSPLAQQKRTNISSKETKKTYFPYANEKSFQNDSFQVTQDVDSDLLQRIDTQKFFLDQFNNGIEDKGEFSFTVSLFVSRDGNKIKETYEVTKPGPNEFLLFLEDNTNDYSKQILRARVGKNIRERLTASQLSQTSIFNYVNKHFNLSKSFLFELAARGYVVEKVSVGGYIFKGILYLLSAVMSPAKAVGWIVNQIGDLVDILKIPDAVWDTESDDYIFKKENVISALTMDTKFLDNWYASLENDPTQIEFNDFIPDFISTKAQAAILKIKQFIESYNSAITNFIERLYKKLEGLSEIPFVATLLENFAFVCGLWNGIVDFISSTLKFIGGILESGFDLATNFEDTLETIDSFWDTLSKVQWSDVWEGLGFLINKIKEYFKSNKSEDYNWVRIAYVSGFGIAFIATLFVPFTQVAKLSGFSKLKKLIPESAIRSIVDGVGTATTKVKTKSKEAYGTFLKNLQKIFAILGKGKNAVKKFFNDIWKKISEWFLKNKKSFETIEQKAKQLLTKDSKTDDLFRDISKKFIVRNSGNISKAKFLKIAKQIEKHFGTKLHWIDRNSQEFAELYKKWYDSPIFAVFHKAAFKNSRYKIVLDGPAIYFFEGIHKFGGKIKITAYTIQHELIHLKLWYQMTKEFPELASVYKKIPRVLDELNVVGEMLKQNAQKIGKWSMNDIMNDIDVINSYSHWKPYLRKYFGKDNVEIKDFENWDISKYFKDL